MLLAVDIGGTKTNMAVFTDAGSLKKPLHLKTFASRAYKSFEAVLDDYRNAIPDEIDRAVICIAAPIATGKIKLTNLPWEIDPAGMQKQYRMDEISLLNDIEALCYALPLLSPEEVHTLNRGNADIKGNIAVLAPGTGLGEAFLARIAEKYYPVASEGGHAEFAPTNRFEIRLLEYLLSRFEHVSFERVCSGMGIQNIYAFLKDSGLEEPKQLTERLDENDDPTRVIIESALKAEFTCEICTRALDTFISILGSEAGNLALKVKATGGLYLGGGIPPAILTRLQKGDFVKAFKAKGRMSYLMENIPIRVVLSSVANLFGAANYGYNYTKEPLMVF